MASTSHIKVLSYQLTHLIGAPTRNEKMKVTVLFLAVGVVLSLPQNFYWTFAPGGFSNPWNFYEWKEDSMQAKYRNPSHDQEDPSPKSDIEEDFEEDLAIEGRKKGSARQNIIRYTPAYYNPAYANSNRVIITLYEYINTVSTTVTIPIVTTCIPLASFKEDAENAGKSATLPCASGRKRRGMFDVHELEESIVPSKIEKVEPTAYISPFTEQDASLVSSYDELNDFLPEDTVSIRQKRQINRRPVTVIVTTDFTSSTYSLSSQVISLTQYSSFSCLPPGTVVCSK